MQTLIDKAWERFVKFDTLSIESQQKTKRWEYIVLTMLIFTPILEFIYKVFAGEAGGNLTDFTKWFPTITIFILSTITILTGLKTFFGEDKLHKERRDDYVLARSLAEELKSTIYLFCMKAGEYRSLNGYALKQLFVKKIKAIVKKSEQLNEQYSNKTETSYSFKPTENMTISAYKTQRLEDQIQFYNNKSKIFEQKEVSSKNWMYFFGLLTVILSSVSTVLVTLKINNSFGFLLVSFFSAVIAALMMGFQQIKEWRMYTKIKNAYKSTANILYFLEDEFGDTLELVEESEKAMRDEHIAWATLMNTETFLPEKVEIKTTIDFTDLEDELN